MRTTEVDCGILDARLIQDPPETWEMPYTRREGQPFFSAGVSSYPCVPRTLDEIPAGALESLREVCAIEGMHQILVIPWAVRPIGFGERKTITPTSVLAVGTAAVGLWTDKPVAGIKASIPVAELAAIQDITVLLYGRLSFLSRNGRLTIRYNTTVRHVFEPALLELRRRRSGSGLPLPREEVSSELEFKWRNILRSTLVRLDVDAPLRFRFARTPPRSRGASPRGHLVALSTHELVYVRDPYDTQYGSDSLVVPRSAIADVRSAADHLAITAADTSFRLSLVPELRDAVARWLGR